MKGLVDTHFHLDHYKDYMKKVELISQLEQYTICVTNSPGVFRSCRKMNLENKYIKFALGYHPLEMTLKKEDLHDFMRLLPLTNYIGEIGLDFSRKASLDKDVQLYAFESIVEAASAHNKLMTIHIKNAEECAIEILKRYCPSKVIIHWYTGDQGALEELVDMGCYFSINSNMVKRKKNDVYRVIPRNRLLIESDGPYSKINEKRYSPELLVEVYRAISVFFEDSELVKHVFENFREILIK